MIKKLKLISKFMKSQLGKQTVTIHLLPNISRGKGNQIMKFGQLKNITIVIFFFKNHTANEAWETSSRSLFAF